jgi:MFS family permease
MYLAYCDCRRKGEAMKIVACVTQGDSDLLSVGRNGLFYDRQGRDWDATVIRIVENPISLRQAFFAPYKKLLRTIEDQVARFAAAKEKEEEARLAGAASDVVGQAAAARPARPAPVDIGRTVGIIAAIGVGAGALGTLLGGLLSGFLGLQPWWAKLVAIAGVFAAISGPSVLIAWLKLRQRTLGPVLDANGWAVNARVKVNLPLGTALTQRAALPVGAARSLRDPYEDRPAARRRRLFWLAVIVVVAALGAARTWHVWPFGPWRWW